MEHFKYLVLDFDGTITSENTIQYLASLFPYYKNNPNNQSNSSDFGANWKDFDDYRVEKLKVLEATAKDISHFKNEILDVQDTDVIEKEKVLDFLYMFYYQFREAEIDSIQLFEEKKVLKGLNSVELFESGNLNWSKDLIRGCLYNHCQNNENNIKKVGKSYLIEETNINSPNFIFEKLNDSYYVTSGLVQGEIYNTCDKLKFQKELDNDGKGIIYVGDSEGDFLAL
ncbi:hypothetical protein HDU92_002576 [Lobulomyces angularis]|nr:hypothetical protein HDU92_002576 [Lobulomyces angularis]